MIIERKPLSQAAPATVAPAEFIGMTLVVLVECQCNAHEQIALTNGQTAACSACGTIYGVDRLAWDRHTQTPKVALSATPVSALVKH